MGQTNYNPDDIYFKSVGDKDAPMIVWTHGWGLSHATFLQIIQSIENIGHHIVVDFPGFGESPKPPDIWGTEEYADALANFIKSKTDHPVIWVGHSFGGRTGIQIATRHPELIKGLCIIAGAGIPKPASLAKKHYNSLKVKGYKALKKLVPLGLVDEDWLKSKFGSPDYRNADPFMRNILVKVVNENLFEIAKNIECPTQLIYGEKDTETPPEIGKTLNELIQGSDLKVLEGLDHYSILAEGRHQITPIIKRFIDTTNA